LKRDFLWFFKTPRFCFSNTKFDANISFIHAKTLSLSIKVYITFIFTEGKSKVSTKLLYNKESNNSLSIKLIA